MAKEENRPEYVHGLYEAMPTTDAAKSQLEFLRAQYEASLESIKMQQAEVDREKVLADAALAKARLLGAKAYRDAMETWSKKVEDEK